MKATFKAALSLLGTTGILFAYSTPSFATMPIGIPLIDGWSLYGLAALLGIVGLIAHKKRK